MQNKKYKVTFNHLGYDETSFILSVWANNDLHAVSEATKMLTRMVFKVADFKFYDVVLTWDPQSEEIS